MASRIEQMLTDHPKMLGTATELITNTPRLNVEGADHIQRAQDWLKHGSIVLYFAPHTTIWDPLLISRAIRSRLTDNPFYWISSIKFTQEMEEFGDLGMASVASIESARRMDFTLLPVIQPYLIREFARKVSREDIKKVIDKCRRINEKTKNTAKNVLQQERSLVAISIEGTRGITGGLLPAQNGIEELLCDERTRALPVTLLGAHKIQTERRIGFSGLNPFVRVGVRFGELISLAQTQELVRLYRWENGATVTVADVLMAQLYQGGLTEILPGVDPQGVYSTFSVKE
jgi:1-acyl-sn-glycerol-3-phosphate acyltransferase